MNADPPVHLLAGHGEGTLEEMRKVLDSLPLEHDHEPKSLEELLRGLREYADDCYRDHAAEPDYDIAPMFDFQGSRGAIPLVAPFDGDEEKEFVFTRMAPLLMEGIAATVWALVHPIWTAPADGDERRPRDRSDKQERVHVHGCDLDRYVSWTAPVDRTERGVRLGAWELFRDVPWDEAAGLVVSPLNEQLIRRRLSSTARRLIWDGEAPAEFWTPERVEALAEVADALDLPDDDPAALRARLRELAADDASGDLFVTLGVFEIQPDGRLWPSRLLLEEAGLPQLVRPVCTCGIEETPESRERYGPALHAPDCPVGKRDRGEDVRA